MLPSEILSRAADLIEPEGRWAQGFWARNSKGETVSKGSASAVCWCIRGAIWKIQNSDFFPAEKVVQGVLDTEFLAEWNDDPDRTQAEVVSALRQASALAKEKEASNV